MGDVRPYALDPALRTMGWASCYPAAPHRSVGGVVHGAAPDAPTVRLYEHGAWLRDQLRRHTPHVVVIEGYSYRSTGRAAISLGELGGVLRVTCLAEGVPVAVVPPTALKLYAVGKGSGKGTDKAAVLQAARDHLDYYGTSHDAADALWLWHMAWHHYNGAALFERHHDHLARAVRAVEWPTLQEATR